MTTVANNNWIPVATGTLPEQHMVEPNLLMSDEVFVTFINMDGEYETGTDKLINNTWAYYGDRVVAWCEKPKAYNPNEAEKADTWISVTDELPPANVLVKVWVTNDCKALDFVNEPFDKDMPFQHYHVKAWRMATRDELNEFISKANRCRGE